VAPKRYQLDRTPCSGWTLLNFMVD